MTDFIKERLEEAKARHRRGRTFLAGLALLSVFAAGAVFWQLRQTGISATSDVVCGLAEHVHTEDCYETHFICGLEEGQEEAPGHTYGPECYEETRVLRCEKEPHTHGDDCYTEKQVLTCALPEHTHGEDCYDSDGTLVCTQEEHSHGEDCYTVERVLTCTLEPHEHDESCYEETKALTCTQEERAPVAHVHTDACRETTLTCTVPEHTHDETCLPDLTADVEDTETLRANAANPGTGIWNTDLLAVAKAQLGYRESTRNFILDDDGTRHGYTRYGESYGDPYGPWDGMFLAYCLRYSGVPEYVAPQRAGVSTMLSESAGSLWLRQGSSETAQPGDIVFFHGTAGVVSLGGETLTVICGDVSGQVAAVSVSAQSVTSRIAVGEAYAAYGLPIFRDNPESTEAGEASESGASSEETEATDAAEATEASEPTDGSQDPDGAGTLVPSGEQIANGFSEGRNSQAPSEPSQNGSLGELDAAFAVSPQDGAAPAASVILEDFIDENKSGFSKKLSGAAGDQWVPLEGDHILDGDEIQLTIGYQLPESCRGTLKATYSIPKGLQVENVSNEPIKDTANNIVGHYEIVNNEVTFYYNEDLWTKHNVFDGTFKVAGKASLISSAEGGEIQFPGIGSLHVDPLNPDCSIAKIGLSREAWDDGSILVRYKVTFSTQNGAGGPISITDQLNNVNASNMIPGYFKEDSVTVTRVSGKTRTPIPLNSQNVSFSDNTTNGKPILTVSNLEALKAGESYEMVYGVIVPPESFTSESGAGKLYNFASGTAGNLSTKLNNQSFVSFFNRIEKSGTYDAVTGRVRWTIKLNNPGFGGAQMTGYTVRDVLPQGVSIVGDVNLYCEDNLKFVQTIDGSIFQRDGFTFPQGYTKTPYTFIFETDVPNSSQAFSLTNTATLTRGSLFFSSSATVQVAQGQWGLRKSLEETIGDTAYWNLTARNSTGATNFTILDSISDGVDNGNNKVSPDSHYAFASELSQAIGANLQLTMTDGTSRSFADLGNQISLSFYASADGTGTPIDPADSTTKVHSFTITVTSENLAVQTLTLSRYPTHLDLNSVPIGRTWTYQNLARVNQSNYISDQVVYRNARTLEKLVSTDGGNTYHGNSTETLPSDGMLYYQLELHTEAGADTLQVEDLIPKSAAYVADRTSITVDGQRNAGTLQVSQNGQQLIFEVSNYGSGQQAHTILIRYALRVSGDPAWGFLGTSQVNYTNTANWGTEKSTVSTTLTREVNKMTKESTQLSLDNKLINKIQYTVYINPAGVDCKENSDVLELTDRLTVPDGVTYTVDKSSIRLYYYSFDPLTNAIDQDREVPRNLWQDMDPLSGDLLRIQVPDETAMILTYVCEFDPGNYSAPPISNTVSLVDVYSTGVQIALTQSSSSATINNGQLILNKQDSLTGELLKGAEFQIDAYRKGTNGSDGIWEELGTYVNQNGVLTRSVTESGENALHPDVLYRITETKAPTDYVLDSTPYYVLFFKQGERNDVFYRATGYRNALPDGSVRADTGILYGLSTGALTLSVKNEPSKLSVQKYWMNVDNQPLANPPVDAILVQLSRDTGVGTARQEVGTPVRLDAANDWKYTWEGSNSLPTVDDQGTPYRYYVEELQTKSNWRVTYNHGIQTGVITIVNQVYSYELPKTGGSGNRIYCIIGSSLLLAAAAGLLYMRKRRKAI